VLPASEGTTPCSTAPTWTGPRISALRPVHSAPEPPLRRLHRPPRGREPPRPGPCRHVRHHCRRAGPRRAAGGAGACYRLTCWSLTPLTEVHANPGARPSIGSAARCRRPDRGGANCPRRGPPMGANVGRQPPPTDARARPAPHARRRAAAGARSARSPAPGRRRPGEPMYSSTRGWVRSAPRMVGGGSTILSGSRFTDDPSEPPSLPLDGPPATAGVGSAPVAGAGADLVVAACGTCP
jgi:hypothetical protein